MYIFLTLLILFLSLFLLIGLVNPKWVPLKGNKTRKKVLLYYGLTLFLCFIFVGMTTPDEKLETKQITETQSEQENIAKTAGNIEKSEISTELEILSNEGEIIETLDYFPIQKERSYIWIGEDNIPRWWDQWEGKITFNGREAYKKSRLVYWGDFIEINLHQELKDYSKWHHIYGFDEEDNIIELGEIREEIEIKDPPEIVLLSEMKVGEKYKIEEDPYPLWIEYLQCLGFSDVQLPNVEEYEDCLVVDNIQEVRRSEEELAGVYHNISYYSKGLGLVMFEVRYDMVEEGILKEGKTQTQYMLKEGFPEIVQEYYDYTPIEYLKLSEVLSVFNEIPGCSINQQNKGQRNKENYKIENADFPNHKAWIWTNGSDIETINIIVSIENKQSVDYYLLMLYVLTGGNAKAVKWITSDETIDNTAHTLDEESKGLSKVFGNTKISISHTQFFEGVVANCSITHKNKAERKTINIDPRTLKTTESKRSSR